ncbi:MAG: ribonuclease HII, partial [Cyanobacteriota bacterium]|nr:ribonuclease HII [Cyanobacteriota bacterium]
MTAQESHPLGRDVSGVGEVGRGCLFGAVFWAAVVLEGSAAECLLKAGLTDS